MKYLSIIFLSLLFPWVANSQTKAIFGKWINVEKNDTTIIELTKDSVYFICFLEDGDTLGGMHSFYEDDSYDDDSVFLDHKYSLNTSFYPHRLTFTAYYAGTDSFNFIIPMVFEFRENNSIAIVIYDEGVFNEDGDNPKEILKEFYAATPKIDEKQDEVIVFKLLK